MELDDGFSLVVLFKFTLFQHGGLQEMALVQPQGTAGIGKS